ncbi:MAG: hypothetical protein V4457_11775 [Pseudomonadota bacterium]
MSDSNTSCQCSGLGFGTICAAIISWLINHSVGWAIIHGIFAWLYVIYWALGFAGQIPPEALK